MAATAAASTQPTTKQQGDKILEREPANATPNNTKPADSQTSDKMQQPQPHDALVLGLTSEAEYKKYLKGLEKSKIVYVGFGEGFTYGGVIGITAGLELMPRSSVPTCLHAGLGISYFSTDYQRDLRHSIGYSFGLRPFLTKHLYLDFSFNGYGSHRYATSLENLLLNKYHYQPLYGVSGSLGVQFRLANSLVLPVAFSIGSCNDVKRSMHLKAGENYFVRSGDEAPASTLVTLEIGLLYNF